MGKRAANKIVQGLEQALDHARVRSAVHAWIREDCPVVVQMSLTPEQVARLVDRVAGTTATLVQTETKR